MKLASRRASPRFRAPLSPASRAVRTADLIATAYLAATSAGMIRFAIATGTLLPLLLHLGALAVAVGVVAAGERAPQPVRDWMPLALGPFLYVELRWLIAGFGRPHLDSLVLGWEHLFFPGNPSATLALRWPNRALSEALHLCYAAYYLLVLVPPIAFAATRRRSDFARTLLALTIVYTVCFSAYLLIPVDGPRFLIGPAHAPDGPVRGMVLHLLATGSSRGTAFPSSHVAASVVASLGALRADRRLGVPIALVTAGLTIATVYGGFHYAVDAVAGLATGIACDAGATALWRRWSAPGLQSATAA